MTDRLKIISDSPFSGKPDEYAATTAVICEHLASFPVECGHAMHQQLATV